MNLSTVLKGEFKMIYKCPNCNGALVFEPDTAKLFCVHCLSRFDSIDTDEVQSTYSIYTCTSCGAELAVDGTETSTYCGY